MSKMTKDQIDALMFSICVSPPKRPSMWRVFFEWLAVSSALIVIAMMVIYLFLGAARASAIPADKWAEYIAKVRAL